MLCNEKLIEVIQIRIFDKGNKYFSEFMYILINQKTKITIFLIIHQDHNRIIRNHPYKQILVT